MITLAGEERQLGAGGRNCADAGRESGRRAEFTGTRALRAVHRHQVRSARHVTVARPPLSHKYSHFIEKPN